MSGRRDAPPAIPLLDGSTRIVQTAATEPPPAASISASLAAHTYAVSSSSVEPTGFARAGTPTGVTARGASSAPHPGSNNASFVIDPIGRLLSFNTSADVLSDASPSSMAAESIRSPDVTAGGGASAFASDLQHHRRIADDRDIVSVTLSEGRGSAAGQVSPDAPPAVISVAARRRMAASARAPLAGPTSAAAAGLNISTAASSVPPTTANGRSMNGGDGQQSGQQRNDAFHFQATDTDTGAFDQLLGDLPLFQTPVGDGGMSLVTVLHEYDVLRSCRGWLAEAHCRTVQLMHAQAQQLVEWQRRRLEEQSEAVLDDLALAMNPTTLAEMFDGVAGALDEVEGELEPALIDRIGRLTSLIPPTAGSTSSGASGGAALATTDALHCYSNMLLLESDRILDGASHVHVTLDSLKAELAEGRAADASFELDRRQARRALTQRLIGLEEEQRSLRLEVKREVTVSIDRDKAAIARFDAVHGQLDALLRGSEMFQQLRSDAAPLAGQVRDLMARAADLREVYQPSTTRDGGGGGGGDDHSPRDRASPASGAAPINSPSEHSPASRARVQFHQRATAISRKLRDHGFDVDAMMSPTAQQQRLDRGGRQYQHVRTACFVDPSIVLATDNARDLGGIEDVADEFFAPMAFEAYDRRATAAAESSRSVSREGDARDDDYRDQRQRSPARRALAAERHRGGRPVSPSRVSQRLATMATPAVPDVLSAVPATLAHLDEEAKRQAAEILDRSQRQQQQQQRPQQQQRSDEGPDHERSTAGDARGISGERPRLPTVAIPDSRVHPTRLSPRAAFSGDDLGAATGMSNDDASFGSSWLPPPPIIDVGADLSDLVPAALRDLMGGPIAYRRGNGAGNTPASATSGGADSTTGRRHEAGGGDESATRPAEMMSPETLLASQRPRRASGDTAALSHPHHDQRQQQQPRHDARSASDDAPRPPAKLRTMLPLSVSHRVGLPFGTRQGGAGGAARAGADSRSSSANDDYDDDGIDYGDNTEFAPTAAPSSAGEPSPARRAADGGPIAEQVTPEHLRGFVTPSQPPDIAYVSTALRGGGGAAAPFMYPQFASAGLLNQQQLQKEREQAGAPSKQKGGDDGTAKQQRAAATKAPRPAAEDDDVQKSRLQEARRRRQAAAAVTAASLPGVFDEVASAGRQRRGDDSVAGTAADRRNASHTLENGYDSQDDAYLFAADDADPMPMFVDPAGDAFGSGDLADFGEVPTIDLTRAINGNSGTGRTPRGPGGAARRLSSVRPRVDTAPPAAYQPHHPHAKPRPKGGTPRPSTFSGGIASASASAPAADAMPPREPFQRRGPPSPPPPSSRTSHVAAPPQSAVSAAARPATASTTASTPFSRQQPHLLPTWLDLMNDKTHLQSEFAPEYMDISRLRLEQERAELDSRYPTYDIAAASRLGGAPPSGGGSSKTAGLPMRGGDGFSTVGSRPTARASQRRDSGDGNDDASPARRAPSISERLREKRVAAAAVPPAPSRPVDRLGTQEDIRRHLDRLKLDTQEAVAKFRGSAMSML